MRRTLSTLAAFSLSLTPALAGPPNPDIQPKNPLFKAEGKPGLSRTIKIDSRRRAEIRTRARNGEIVRLKSVPLPDGTTVSVDLEEFRPLSSEFEMTLSTPASKPGGKPTRTKVDLDELILLKGHVKGKPDSGAFLAMMPGRIDGRISFAEKEFRISHDESKNPNATISHFQHPTIPFGPQEDQCQTCSSPACTHSLPSTLPASGAVAGFTTEQCKVVRVAFEADYEFFNGRFSNDEFAMLLYFIQLIDIADSGMKPGAGVGVELVNANAWTEQNDPWDKPNATSQVNQFMDYCNDPANEMLAPERDTTFLISGRPLMGGAAPQPGICVSGRGYGAMSARGSVTYPPRNNQENNRDGVIFLHELGHNLDGNHTHEAPLELDGFVFGQCEGSENSPLMSYGHMCSGSWKNFTYNFHILNRVRMHDYAEAAQCLTTTREALVQANNDTASGFSNTPTPIDVCANDYSACSRLEIGSYDLETAEGGMVRIDPRARANSRDILHYYPRRDFTGIDTFSYQVIDEHDNASMAQVTVEVTQSPYLTDPEYLIADSFDKSIRRVNAHTLEPVGVLLEAFPEFLDMPSSILPLPDLSILVGDRSLSKVFDVDIHGNYRGVFFEHPDLINCEAMVHDGQHVYIMDALGGWVFKTDLDGQNGYAIFQGSGVGIDMAMGSDGMLWITGSVNGNDVIAIDPTSGSVHHEIPELQDIELPGAITFVNGMIQISDRANGGIARISPMGASGHTEEWAVSPISAGEQWLGGGIEFAEGQTFEGWGQVQILASNRGLFELYDNSEYVWHFAERHSTTVHTPAAIAYIAPANNPADLNQDGKVDGADFGLLLTFFGPSSTGAGDLNSDWTVDGSDVGLLLAAWTG